MSRSVCRTARDERRPDPGPPRSALSTRRSGSRGPLRVTSGKARGEHIMSGPPPIFAEHQMGSCSRNPSCEAGSPLGRAQVLRGSWSSFATRSACVSAGTAQRATMRGHSSIGGAPTSVGLWVTIWRRRSGAGAGRSSAPGRPRAASTRGSGRCGPGRVPSSRRGRCRPPG